MRSGMYAAVSQNKALDVQDVPCHQNSACYAGIKCLPASTWRCLPKNRRHRHRLPVPCGWNAAWILSYFVESKTQLTLNISAIWCEWSMIVTFWTMNGLKTLVLLLMDIYLKAHFVFEVLVGGCGWLCKSSGVFRTGTINARRVPREIDISWRGGLSQKRV